MSESKMKPVWRLNTDNEIDFSSDVCVYVYDKGVYKPVLASLMGFNYVSTNDIYAYQTNRTKPAKYR